MIDESPKQKIASKLEKMFQVRYLALIVSFFLMLNGILAIALGVKHLWETVLILFGNHDKGAGSSIITSIDTFLFALVILILAGGIFKLFVGNQNTFKESAVFSKLNNFKDLKVLLWETILLTLTVWCALGFFIDSDKLLYEQLILPFTILLLALALNFIKKGEH
ncbi:YqhA family protein [Gaetbulibacter aquiaggeris]|uniref:YqhA family protein n=1 Tax=Gaetbulibacter aquiaggeris TaxID=1735373 RepID=A0ABW7MK54_9FLAO